MITGHKSGFFCLAVDGEAGEGSLLHLEKQFGVTPADTTCMAVTPFNGVHYYFKMPENQDLRNSAGKLGKNLDIRANGGYMVVPPRKVISRDGIEACCEWINPEIMLAKGQLPNTSPWLSCRPPHQNQLCRKIDSSIIGRAAAKMGIQNIYARRKRCKEFSEEILNQLKIIHYL